MKAVIWIIAIVVGIAGAIVVLMQSAENVWVSSIKSLAEIQVKIKLRDTNASFENVIFHPIEGSGRFGSSYVCGYVKPSYDAYAAPKRFLYMLNSETVAIAGELREADLHISSICNRAPLPVELFDTSDNQFRLKPR